MKTAKGAITLMLNNLPENCSLEDIQYHLYVLEKVHQGAERAETEGTMTHAEVKRRFSDLIKG
jgi:hypothetical protein